MALQQSKLALMFQGAPVVPEADAIAVLASRFTDFFLDATVAGVPALPGPLVSIEATFRSRMAGLSSPGQAAFRTWRAISGYWSSAMLVAPTIWITAPVIFPASGIRPPGINSINSALAAVFASNLAGELNLTDASNAAAAALLPLQLGATVVLSPGGGPLIPVL